MMGFEKWKKAKIEQIRSETWLTPQEQSSMIKDWMKFRKDLRRSYKFYASNMFGKKINELTTNDIRIILNSLVKDKWSFLKSVMSFEVFKDAIRITFSSEIKRVKRGLLK